VKEFRKCAARVVCQVPETAVVQPMIGWLEGQLRSTEMQWLAFQSGCLMHQDGGGGGGGGEKLRVKRSVYSMSSNFADVAVCFIDGDAVTYRNLSAWQNPQILCQAMASEVRAPMA
jgi:hypothetical protein